MYEDPGTEPKRTRQPPAPLALPSPCSVSPSTSSASYCSSTSSPRNPFTHILPSKQQAPMCQGEIRNEQASKATSNREHPRRPAPLSKRVQQEAAAIAAQHYSALADGVGSSAHRPPRPSDAHHHHHHQHTASASTGAPSTDLVSALYRRIHDLESENLAMKEQLREPQKGKAESRPHDEDEALPPQGLRAAKVGACKDEDSKAPGADEGEEEEEEEGESHVADEAGEGARTKKQPRPRVRVRPARYPLGISRYSWPPGSPNSSLTRSLMEALEEVNGVPSGSVDRVLSPVGPSLHSHSSHSAPPPTPINFHEFVVVGISPRVLSGECAPLPHEQQLEILERVSSSCWEEGEGPIGGGDGAGPLGPPSLAGHHPPSLSSLRNDSMRGSVGSSGSSIWTDAGGIEKIADFCFPQGGRLELAPLATLDAHTGRHRDQTHVLQFTDSLGATTYGLCITIYEPCTDAPSHLYGSVRDMRQRHVAAAKIQNFLRRRCGSLLDGEAPLMGSMMGEEGGWVRKGLLNSVRSRMKRLQLTGSGWGTPRQGPSTPVNSSKMHRQRSSNEGLFGRSPPTGSGVLISGSIFGRSPPVGTGLSVLSPPPPQTSHPAPPRLILRAESDNLDLVHGAERRDTSPERERRRVVGPPEVVEGVVVAPRCFCLLSSAPNHPLLYKVLQLIVDRERRTSVATHKGPGAPRGSLHYGMNNPQSSMKRRHSCNAFLSDNSSLNMGMGPCLSPRLDTPPAAHQDQHVARRQFLRYVQGDVSLPTSGSTTLSFPRYLHAATRLDFPLVPLQHWTTAVLFSRLSADVIIRCLNVLLLETSLIIVGEDLGLVSAIGTALISLLEPFQWDGVFIPLLPSSLSDFLQSPVPLVVGVVPPFDASRHMGAAVLTIGGGQGEDLRTPQLQVKLPLCYQLLQELHEHSKIFSVRRSRWANLHLSTYMNGLTQEESGALLGLRKILRSYVENLCGDLKYHDAWRKYGAFNSTTQDFEFYPGWFLGPLQMMLEFQSAFVHTQMFVSYVDRRRAQDLQLLQQRLRAQHFVGLFCFFKFVHRRRRERATRHLRPSALQYGYEF